MKEHKARKGVSTMDLNSANWRTSARSGNNGGNCVEVAGLDHMVAVRDSKHPDGPTLRVTRTGWHTLTTDITNGRYDL
jgi:Domain of unknown function (DUF397)